VPIYFALVPFLELVRGDGANTIKRQEDAAKSGSGFCEPEKLRMI